MSREINVSIVAYRTPFDEIEACINRLRQSGHIGDIYIIDNSPDFDNTLASLDTVYIHNGKNAGYGTAHNVAIRRSLENGAKYHLVMNSDITFDSNIFDTIVPFLDNHTDIAALMPKAVYPTGEIQRLCRLLPSPADLLCRRTLPKLLTRKRIYRYEMQRFSYDNIINVPFISGCFMMLRCDALRAVGLFDERYFMYMEDVDLSRRLHRQWRTVFFPQTTIIHMYRRSSSISKRMLIIHFINMCRYFNKWGWFFDKERHQINNAALSQEEIPPRP